MRCQCRAQCRARGVGDDIAYGRVAAGDEEVLQRFYSDRESQPGKRRAAGPGPGQAQEEPERHEQQNVLKNVLHALVTANQTGNRRE